MQNHSDSTVHLHRDGVLHSFPPRAHIPDWAQKLITNPYVRGEDAPDPRAAAQVRALAPGHARPAPTPAPEEPVADDAPVDADDADADEATEAEPDADTAPAAADSSRPPENGIGSGQPVWAEYAKSKGIDVQADWKREDIIAACAQAGF